MARPSFSSDRYGPKRLPRFFRKLVQWQREAPLSTPVTRRIDMRRSGYRAASYTLYDLSPAHAGEYLPDSARLETYFINGSFARAVLNDKLLFTSLLHHHLPIPKLMALVERGETFAREQSEDVLSLAQRHGDVIFKPSDGTHGRGVYHLKACDGLALNGHAVTPDEVRGLIEKLDNYLVTETVQQAAYARIIYPEATNSLRVWTLLDPNTNEPFIACAVHRFGTPETVPTDN